MISFLLIAKRFLQVRTYGLVVLLLLQACGDTKAPLTHSASSTATADTKTSTNATTPALKGAHLLVFSKTTGWRHDSIPAGLTALEKLASAEGFTLTTTEESSLFKDAELAKFNAIIFLNTTGDVLNEQQELAMERYIQSGGGFVGIHSATDTETQGDWYWFRNLAGAVFKNHPNEPSNVQSARVVISDHQHESTKHLPGEFALADEWYNFRDIYEHIQVLAKVDESSYQGGEHGQDHPISWYHEYDGGRAFYTGLGHSAETFSNEHFLTHLLGGIRYAVGLNYRADTPPQLDYRNARPESNRFIKKTLVENLDEPVKFDFFPNGDALIALRPGQFKRVDYRTGVTHPAGSLAVEYHKTHEWGLVGVAVDPEFAQNSWVYAAFNTKDETGQFYQKLSRFLWRNNQVDAATEQELLRYPIDSNCCHTGGDLQFGNQGELFFSTGDNTNPHDQEGYAPIDFRPDLIKNDALRSAGNTQDLRGKVLRIKPKAEGGYDIPAGNLFTTPEAGRPEIYVMGARNPYSITFDKKTNTLFYGDVGPDANTDSEQKGVRGYDEINRVTAAGNFGWPLVIGQNRPYRLFDYVNQTPGDWVDLNAPLNRSPLNTGAHQLPAAQPALIAYPYAASDEFPELGVGGRTALVADVFYSDQYPESINRYPAYYNKKLFIADFMRAWIKVVSIDEQGRIRKIEPFAPQLQYTLPIDARFSPDGTLYVLEYGSSWFTGNPDARLARIEYVGSGNRPPLAQLEVNKTQAGLPAMIQASAAQSTDLDGDSLRYAWSLSCAKTNCKTQALGEELTVDLLLNTAGRYTLTLRVTDSHGAAAVSHQALDIGNEPTHIELRSAQNQSFFWRDTTGFDYELTIQDREDGKITQLAAEKTLIQFNYRAPAANNLGHQQASAAQQAEVLLAENNCLTCHKLNEKIVGPALRDVAKKYANDPNAEAYLIHKIGNGGSGVWGDMNMPAFAGLGEADLRLLAGYVLSLNQEPKVPESLPLAGRVALDAHDRADKRFTQAEPFNSTGEAYQFSVVHTDNAVNGVPAITRQVTFELIPHRLELDSLFNPAHASKNITRNNYGAIKTLQVPGVSEWAGLVLGNYDLSEVKAVQLGGFFAKAGVEWQIELRRDNPQGELLAQGLWAAGEAPEAYQRTRLELSPSNGFSQLYLQLKTTTEAAGELFLQDISFEK